MAHLNVLRARPVSPQLQVVVQKDVGQKALPLPRGKETAGATLLVSVFST